MKSSHLIMALGLGAFAAGPALADAPIQVVPTQTARVAQPVYKSIWRQDDKGDIVHLQSGLACDAGIGTFRRTEVHAYSPTGLDVSCNYLDAQHSGITLYLTRRAAQSLDDDFKEAEREMIGMYPDASPIAAPVAAAAADFTRIAFYSRQGGQIREGIWIGDVQGWTLEYRGTWQPGDEAATLAEIAALTARASASAGTELGLCAKLPSPVRDGVAVTDKSEISSALVSATLLAAAVDLPDAVPDKSAAITWCAESPVGDGDDAVLLWHGVHADGSDALIDRVTPYTLEEPQPVTSSVDSSLNDILSEMSKAPKAKPRWTIAFANDEGNWTMAFYDGRPPASALAKVVLDLRDHKAHPLGGYNAKGKNITISLPEGK